MDCKNSTCSALTRVFRDQLFLLDMTNEGTMGQLLYMFSLRINLSALAKGPAS
jgi:hypothetical protein